MMTETELRHHFPFIRWHEPVMVSLIEGGAAHFGCRFCIAQHGLHGSEVEALPKTAPEWQEHMRKFHTPKL